MATVNAVLDIMEREDIPSKAKTTGEHLKVSLRTAFSRHTGLIESSMLSGLRSAPRQTRT